MLLTNIAVAGDLRVSSLRNLEHRAQFAGICPSLATSIAKVESQFNSQAINEKSWDYGLMQVNHRTAAAYGHFPFEMLNEHQNVGVALKVLQQIKKQFKHEAHWECRYNVGWHKNAPKWDSCNVYIEKLVKAGYRKCN